MKAVLIHMLALLNGLFSRMENATHRRKTELIERKPGAILADAPEFILVKMLKQPKSSANRLSLLCGKFNNTFENMLFTRKGRIPSYILSIQVDQEGFFPNGELTNTGKHKFWQEIDSCIKKFKRREINLKPKHNKKDDRKKKKSCKSPKRPGCLHYY